ncbi:MAG: hypothetical protein ABSF00_06275 [Candidatus Bathyarchaeia archaeon]
MSLQNLQTLQTRRFLDGTGRLEDQDDIARLALDLKGWIKQISRWTKKSSI